MLRPHTLSVLPCSMQKVEEMFAVTLNSLPFVLPMEEVMTLANTSRVRHQQRMHRGTFSLSREHMEANGGSTLLSRLVFRRTRDQERMATQSATTLKSCSGQQQELDVETFT